MGGRKKPTLSQLEKRMRREAEEKAKEKRREKKVEMKLDAKGELTQLSMDHIVSEVSKMKYVTPYLLSSRVGIKMSRARAVLRELAARGVLKVVDKNRRVPIYVPAKAS